VKHIVESEENYIGCFNTCSGFKRLKGFCDWCRVDIKLC